MSGDAKAKGAGGKGGKGDGRFFATTQKGEIHELQQDLNSVDKNKIKEAVKKVIAAMTVGKDVSVLFTDVVKSMQTPDIELKKLIYLYIINYARTQPDKAILVVNTFQKDASDLSPLVRALAIRTMGCIRVDRITEYLCEPLRQALKDKDPYVRKTAAVCVAKLYDINAELVEEQDFLDQLRDMISDPNPMVVANAVAALAEISESSGKDVFHISSTTLQKLLAALNECTEWGQVFLLDALSKYEPSPAEAETIIERVIPRLQHANSAVAMSAVKVIMKYLDRVRNADLVAVVVQQKLPPPLITLLSEHKPEIQYVTLRNVNLIVQKRPEVLAKEVKHFFCKYNDPIYVKMEKLEIMIQLVNAENVEQVLLEFKEYASEVDVEFVRRAVSAIGRCAIKLERAAERCIKVLLELIQTKVNYVVQQAVIVIRDVFRKYPNRYESIIATLCENLDTLDEPEAKASMVWIIGEYAARIENAPELLEAFVGSFQDEAVQVQLQILTATVKLFLRRPEDAKDMVTQVLNMATENSDNPDLRDRGYVYWRLLATDPEAAQAVVLAEKPVIRDDTHQLEAELLDQLIANISTLAAIYHKPPEAFVKGGKTFVFRRSAGGAAGRGGGGGGGDDDEEEEEEEEEEDNGNDDDGAGGGGGDDDEGPVHRDDEGDDDGAGGGAGAAAGPPSPRKAKGAPVMDILGDLADLGMGDVGMDAGAFGGAAGGGVQRTLVLPSEKGNGLQISNAFVRRDGRVFMDLLFQNHSRQVVSQFQIKVNKNTFNLQPAGPVQVAPVQPGGQAEVSVELRASDNNVDETAKPGLVQCALRTELGIVYFQDTLYADALFEEGGELGKAEFLQLWKSLADEDSEEVPSAARTVDAAKARLEPRNLFTVATRSVPGKGEVLYMSLRLRGWPVLAELTLTPAGSVLVCVKSEAAVLRASARAAIAHLLQ